MPVSTRLKLFIVLSLAPCLWADKTYYFCPDDCNVEVGFGTCQEDGTCLCSPGHVGVDCSQVRAGLSLQKRRDGSHGYRFITRGEIEGDRRVADLAYSAGNGRMYASVYDSSGRDAVIEISSIGDTEADIPGWGESGPARPRNGSQPLPMVPIDASWCGTGIAAGNMCSQSHPGGRATPGWSDEYQTAHGWRDEGGYRDIALDSTRSFVYTVLNMWRAKQSDTSSESDVDDPYEYKFRIYRWDGRNGSLASTQNRSEIDFYTHSEGWILDAMTINDVDGTLIYKATPRDVNSKSHIGVLEVQNDVLISVKDVPISPSYLGKRCTTCATRRDAFRFNAATSASIHGDQYVIFVGSSRTENSDASYYPSVLKIHAEASKINDGGVDGPEMYFDGNNRKKIDHSTFKSVVAHGQYAYAGTASAGCRAGDCNILPGRIWMFSLTFTDVDDHGSLREVVLSAGENEGPEEINVHRMAVLPDETMNGGFLFALTGKSATSTSRIVKLEIGGPDTAASCTAQCFRRIASYISTEPLRAMVYAQDVLSLITASLTEPTVTYARLSTAEIISISPRYGPTSGASTIITIAGSGFPKESTLEGKSNFAACRFGFAIDEVDVFPIGGWVPAIVVNDTIVHCTVPQAGEISVRKDYGPLASGVSIVQLSFDGFHEHSVTNRDRLFNISLWTDDKTVYRFYTVPLVTRILANGVSPPSVMITGEDADQVPSQISLIGGPFINTKSLVCRFNQNASSDQPAIFITATMITCPICRTHVVSKENGKTRCFPLGATDGSVDFYQAMKWLPNDDPRFVTVAFSMNARDFHMADEPLRIYGSPHHLQVIGRKTVEKDSHGSVQNQKSMTFGTIHMQISDINGFVMGNDVGEGGTRGFSVKITMNASVSPRSSSAAELESGFEGVTDRGSLALTPRFSQPLTRGDYYLILSLHDCTRGIDSCINMPGITTQVITVFPGAAAQILVRPGYVSANDQKSGWSADGIIKAAALSVELGSIFVDILDGGSNQVGDLDRSLHTIHVVSTTSQTKFNGILGADMLEERVSGAGLYGTTVVNSLNGKAIFSDLKLVNQEPTGMRYPGSASTLTFGMPSQGFYRLQFYAEMRGPHEDAYALSVSKLEIIPGQARYLNVSNYADLIIVCDSSEEVVTTTITLNIFDGGNNKLTKDEEHRTVNVLPHGQPALHVYGTISQTDNVGAAEWRFPAYSFSLGCRTIGLYGLEFSSPAISPSVQVVRMVSGTRGYQWRAIHLVSTTDLPSAPLVQIGNFRLEVLDGGGNQLFANDRYNIYSDADVSREVMCFSATASLTGTIRAHTERVGYVEFSNLLIVRPIIGAHVIRCIEQKVTVYRTPELIFQSSDDGFAPLLETAITVHIVAGERAKLHAHVLADASKATAEYSLSLGNINVSTFRKYASMDDHVPLDTLRVLPMDAGGNPLSGKLPSFNVSTTDVVHAPKKGSSRIMVRDPIGGDEAIVRTFFSYPSILLEAVNEQAHGIYRESFRNVTLWQVVNQTHVEEFNISYQYNITTITHKCRYISITLPDVATDGFYPHITGYNAIQSRGAVLVTLQKALNKTASTFHDIHEMEGFLNDAVINNLALFKPPHGTFDVLLTTDPLDPMLSSATIQVTVHPGRAHHLGISAPCRNFNIENICETSIGASPESDDDPCTCIVYNVSEVVALSPIRAYILDSGENILRGTHDPPCKVGGSSCPKQKITMNKESIIGSEICLLHLQDSSSPSYDASKESPKCLLDQPDEVSGIPYNGLYSFTDLALLAPRQATTLYPLLMAFTSPGIIGVSFGIEILPGLAVKLGLALPPRFSLVFQSMYTTVLSSSASPFFVQILDAGGSAVGITDSHSRPVRIICNSAKVGAYPGGPGIGEKDLVYTQRDFAYFASIRLLSPQKGAHDLQFSSPFLHSVTLTVRIIEGHAVRLKVLSMSQAMYTSQPLIMIKPIIVGVYDAGSNYVGSSNLLTKPVYANITDSPIGATKASKIFHNTDFGNIETLQSGEGTVTFDRIHVRSPLIGLYNITFGGDGLLSDIASFLIEIGSPYKLSVPDMHTMVNDTHFCSTVLIIPTHCSRPPQLFMYELRTDYLSERILRIDAFAVVVMDGGNNLIGQLDVDQLGTGLRRDLITSVRGSLEKSTEHEDSQCSTAGEKQSMTEDKSFIQFSVSTRRTALGESIIDDLQLMRPKSGIYIVTISSPSLVAHSFHITVAPGPMSILDVCGCPTCSYRALDGLCVDSQVYRADTLVSLKHILVVIRDAGGALVQMQEAQQTRNVTVELIYGKNLATGVEVTYTANATILSNRSQTQMLAIDGSVAWCRDGSNGDPIPQFCRPSDVNSEEARNNALEAYSKGVKGAGSRLGAQENSYDHEECAFYGIEPVPKWSGRAYGLYLENPYVGLYRFRFSSYCPMHVCKDASYQELYTAELEITVIPGVPKHLVFLDKPPLSFENDFVITPSIRLRVLDIANNICNDLNTFATVSVFPKARNLDGQIAPLTNGITAFTKLRILGDRGGSYSLQFDVITVGLSMTHFPFILLGCEDVKPNSQNDRKGQCECMPGYTEDIRRGSTAYTGYTDAAKSLSTNTYLYKQVVPMSDVYLRVLHPYGVCVPCANGHYKQSPGPQGCTACPNYMDTSQRNGHPNEMWTTFSGERLPGFLGNYEMNACHCISQQLHGSDDRSLSTYRSHPEASYTCRSCPIGALCNGLSPEHIVVKSGFWRTSGNITIIYKCPNPNTCLGGVHSVCATGHEGNLCAVCSHGYASSSMDGHNLNCKDCSSAGIGVLVLTTLFVVHGAVVMAVFRIAIRRHNITVGLCRIVLSHFQMMVIHYLQIPSLQMNHLSLYLCLVSLFLRILFYESLLFGH